MRSKMKICFICSSGGHFEQIKQLKQVEKKYDCFYVLTKTKSTQEVQSKKYLVSFYGRKNKFSFALNIIIWFIEELAIFFKEKPDVIITTGAADAIPMCLISKFFGKKVIYIETFARRNEPSKTGKFIYRFADLFIIQWKELQQFYPNAVYGGWIY